MKGSCQTPATAQGEGFAPCWCTAVSPTPSQSRSQSQSSSQRWTMAQPGCAAGLEPHEGTSAPRRCCSSTGWGHPELHPSTQRRTAPPQNHPRVSPFYTLSPGIYQGWSHPAGTFVHGTGVVPKFSPRGHRLVLPHEVFTQGLVSGLGFFGAGLPQ